MCPLDILLLREGSWSFVKLSRIFNFNFEFLFVSFLFICFQACPGDLCPPQVCEGQKVIVLALAFISLVHFKLMFVYAGR